MNTRCCLRICLLACAAGSVPAQEPFTYETPARLFSTGDWNGDAITDAVVLDRATGALSFGFQSAAGAYVWSDGPATGAAAASCLTVGRQGTRDIAGVTAPDLGRLLFIDLASSAAQPGLTSVYPNTASPQSMAFFPLTSATQPELLITGDRGTGLGNRYTYELRPPVLGSTFAIWEEYFNLSTSKIAASTVKTGTPPRVLEYYGNSLFIEGVTLTSLTSGPGSLASALTNSSTLYAQGNFDGTAYSQYFFYDPGTSSVRTAKITEPTPGTYGWSTLGTFSFPSNIRLLTTMPKTGGGHRLGVIFTDGSASLYNYTGAGVPSLYRSLSPAGSAAADVLLPSGPDAVLVARGGQWQRFLTQSGDPLTPVNSGVFNLPGPASAVSNIIWLTAEAFAKPDAAVTGTGQFREWTTGAFPSWIINGQITNGSSGLGNETFTNRTAPANTTSSLINQVRPNVSITLTNAPPGLPAGEVIIAPPGGVYPPGDQPPGAGAPAAWITGTSTPLPASLKYDQPPVGGELIKIPPWLTVSLQPVRSGDSIRYRINDGAWATLPALGQIELYADATIESFATSSAGRSPVRRQSYTFTAPRVLGITPGADTNGNGLTDQWEKTFGASNANDDQDGDGASNLAEFQAGTDPNDPASAPVRLELNASRATGAGGRPVLRLEWSAADASVRLETAAALTGPWNEVTSGITTASGTNRYDVSFASPAPLRNFYRLRRP